MIVFELYPCVTFFSGLLCIGIKTHMMYQSTNITWVLVMWYDMVWCLVCAVCDVWCVVSGVWCVCVLRGVWRLVASV